MAELTIATFNINGVNNRLANLLEWLARETPDVVCLQELKATDQQFPLKAITDAGYGAIWRGEPLWNGVAILARGARPIETRRALPGQEHDPHARYLEAAVHGVLVGNLYLPNGNPLRSPKFAYKLAWFESLIGYAATLCGSEHPVALLGDYNVVPTDDDIYDPKSWLRDALLQPESRACYRRLLAQGWYDSLRERSGGERVYTYWDYFRKHWQRNAGLRIDHLLLNPRLAPALVDVGVHRWVRDQPHASDHAPVWMRLELGAGGAKPRGAKSREAAAKPAGAKSREAGAKSRAAAAKPAGAKPAGAKPTVAKPRKAPARPRKPRPKADG
jgi:exodeoxyribonuclease-3